MVKIKKLQIIVNGGDDLDASYEFDDFKGVGISVVIGAVESAQEAFCSHIEKSVSEEN